MKTQSFLSDKLCNCLGLSEMLSYDIRYHLCRSFYSEETAVDHQIPVVQVRRIVIGIFLMILPSGLIDLHDHFYSHILFHAKLCHTVLDPFFKGSIDINIETVGIVF